MAIADSADTERAERDTRLTTFTPCRAAAAAGEAERLGQIDARGRKSATDEPDDEACRQRNESRVTRPTRGSNLVVDCDGITNR